MITRRGPGIWAFYPGGTAVNRRIMSTLIPVALAAALAGCAQGASDPPPKSASITTAVPATPTPVETKSTTTSVPSPIASAPTVAPRTSRTTASKAYTCHYGKGTAPCTLAAYEANKKMRAEQQRSNSATARPSSTAIKRDKNGFALGGPPAPAGPANYDHPSHTDCLRFRTELRAWSNYQNQHRPAGSTNDLPSSGEVQYLFVVCGLKY